MLWDLHSTEEGVVNLTHALPLLFTLLYLKEKDMKPGHLTTLDSRAINKHLAMVLRYRVKCLGCLMGNARGSVLKQG